MRTLKRAWSLYLIPRDDIVSKGLYKWVRHPSYTGTFFIILGLAMIHQMLGLMYLAFVFLLHRSSQEELILMMNPKYQQYMKSTKRFIPYLL